MLCVPLARWQLDSVISAGSVFKEDVRSSLPYIEIVTQAEYRYVGVLIDDERILGMKVRSLRIFMSLSMYWLY